MHAILNIALRAAREASDLIVQSAARPDRVQVFEKARNDFVTDIDRAVEQTLIQHIRKAYPKHSFLCEETGFTEGDDPDSVWVIDPIDGTRNFILGFPHFCTSIAFLHKDKVQHGLIFDPIRGDIFSASKGGGAQLNGQRMRVGTKHSLEKATISMSSSGLKHYQKLIGLQEKLQGQIGGLRFTGSAALDLAYVASGRLDGGWISGLNKWDVAAGILMVQEAGGLVSDERGNPDCLNEDTLVFANPKCFRQLLKQVAEHRSESARAE